MTAALVTAVALGAIGLSASAVLGLRGSTETAWHISLGFFSAMVTLLAHSMMMFYLLGRGKAVKDAMAEGHLTGDYDRRIAVARKPAFSVGVLAMAVTMMAAIIGASADTGLVSPSVHAIVGYGAIVCNLAALRVEVTALSKSARVVEEVDRLLCS